MAETSIIINPIKAIQIGELIKKFHGANIKVIGNSMLPFLCPNDIVELKKLKLRNHQIILFEQGTRAVLHRIAFILGNIIITRGDNSMFYEIISKKYYLGTVINRANVKHEICPLCLIGFNYQLGAMKIIFTWYCIRNIYIMLHKPQNDREKLYAIYKEKLLSYNSKWITEGRTTWLG